MKKLFFLATFCVLTAAVACNNENQGTTADSDNSTAASVAGSQSTGVVPGEYVNLETGNEVYVIPDEETGKAIDRETKDPIRFYVNTKTGDTLFRTGVVVNHQLINQDGKWEFDEAKVEVDGDEIKIKDNYSKLKVDDGDMKYKEGDDKKIKTEKDGDAKIKTATSKTKIEEDGEVKTKNKD